MPAPITDRLLVQRIRAGDPDAWRECIARYEGRLTAFVDSRIRDRAAAEDVVQDTFIGFLNALVNFDDQTPLEAFLFSIAAHKLTDLLRRRGRRPARSFEDAAGGGDGGGAGQPASRGPAASSLARSQERRTTEEQLVAGVLAPLISGWREQGEFERLKCLELLFVSGLPNKRVAVELGISEQQVANHKQFVVAKLKQAAERLKLRTLDLSQVGAD